MVRPGLRRSEIDWENVDIHISREEMERDHEHSAAVYIPFRSMKRQYSRQSSI